MAKQIVNNGTVAGDKTGENLFSAFTKVNANFTELYDGVGGLVAKSGAAVSHTGNTIETTLATIAIPANSLGANGVLRVVTMWSVPNSANTKTGRVRLGATTIASLVGTVITTMRMDTTLLALNATNSQNTVSFYSRGSDAILVQGFATSATDMTLSQNLTITAQLALGTETMTLVGYIIQMAK